MDYMNDPGSASGNNTTDYIKDYANGSGFVPSVDLSAVQEEIASLANSAFGKGLAATIMANFPITCYISIFMGLAGLKKAKKAAALAEENGLSAGGKNTAGKILSIIGLAYGAYMSLTWTMVIAIYAIYAVILIAAALLGGL